MYSLFRALPLRRLLFEQGLGLTISLLIAELFYKFHSFTLECVAFLATWYIVDWVIQYVCTRVRAEGGALNRLP